VTEENGQPAASKAAAQLPAVESDAREAPTLDTHSQTLRLAVRTAFALGWQVGELLEMAHTHKAVTEARDKGEATVELESDQDGDRTRLLADAVNAGLCRLKIYVQESSLDKVEVPGEIRRTSDDAVEPLGDAAPLLERFHHDLRVGLTVADFRLGKAYRLGCELAETCLCPEGQEDFDRMFGTRMVPIRDRLTDLATALPPHASRAVALSLRAWETWAADPEIDAKDVVWQVQWPAVRAALRRQGELWRALLSGEKDGRDMLRVEDYLDATGRLLRHTMRLIFAPRRLGTGVALGIVALVLLVGGAAVVIFTNAQTTAAIAAALGAVGVTTAGIRRFAGSKATQLQEWLWAAELDFAIANAITKGPTGWSGTVGSQLPAAGASPSAAHYLKTLEQFRDRVSKGRRGPIVELLAPRVTFAPNGKSAEEPEPLRCRSWRRTWREDLHWHVSRWIRRITARGAGATRTRGSVPVPNPTKDSDPVAWLRAHAEDCRIAEQPVEIVAGEGRFVTVLTGGEAHVWRVREGKIQAWRRYAKVNDARKWAKLPQLTKKARTKRARQST
jgi:hypothetical protein